MTNMTLNMMWKFGSTYISGILSQRPATFEEPTHARWKFRVLLGRLAGPLPPFPTIPLQFNESVSARI